MIKNVELLSENDFKRLPAEKRQEHYGELVERLIRKKYSVSAEFAILRQRDEKPTEFAKYNEYAEQCKVVAKKILKI
jgi:hypothetical protein